MGTASLTLRLFADCADEPTATQLQGALLQALAAFQPAADATPKRYWKIPEYFEFSFALAAAGADDYARLQALSPGGWTTGGDDDDAWAVWNRADGRAFLLPAVAWAEAQLTRRDD